MVPTSRRRRGPASPIVQVTLDPQADTPMYRQLYHGLREAILAGRFAGGTRLPSSRALANDLGVARNTVLQAFDQLRSEGYLAGRRGGGTRVRGAIPDAMLAVPPRPPSRARTPARPTRGATSVAMPVLSTRGRALVAGGAQFIATGRAPVPFELGVPAADAFPVRLWGQLAARRWRRGAVDLGDTDPAGDRALRAAIASYVATARGAQCTADQVLVLNGAQQALHLIAHVLLDAGDSAWIEDPGYFGARTALEAAGVRLVPVPVDAEGLDVDAGIRSAAAARLAYVTPSHQFPLGAVMSAPRRLRLLAWARAAGAWIVEDDYDSEFRYAGRPLPCLQGLEAAQGDGAQPSRVLYVGTFSKTLVPGLRLGYMVVPDALVDPFRAARSATDRHTTTLHQGVLADFIGDGHYARHIRRIRALCAERQAVLVDAAAARLGGLLTLAPDPAGLHLVGRLAPGIDDAEAARLALANGVRTAALSRFHLAAARHHGDALLLGYAAFGERRIREGVDRLEQALRRRTSKR
jgi:GntR family transcriptional regulator / MocR family aminotransferase